MLPERKAWQRLDNSADRTQLLGAPSDIALIVSCGAKRLDRCLHSLVHLSPWQVKFLQKKSIMMVVKWIGMERYDMGVSESGNWR